jgi:hypothetical protein
MRNKRVSNEFSLLTSLPSSWIIRVTQDGQRRRSLWSAAIPDANGDKISQ